MLLLTWEYGALFCKEGRQPLVQSLHFKELALLRQGFGGQAPPSNRFRPAFAEATAGRPAFAHPYDGAGYGARVSPWRGLLSGAASTRAAARGQLPPAGRRGTWTSYFFMKPGVNGPLQNTA